MTNATVHLYADALGIRQQDAIALAVRMADIVATHGALLANFTDFSHNHTSFWCANSHNTHILAPEPIFGKPFFAFATQKQLNSSTVQAVQKQLKTAQKLQTGKATNVQSTVMRHL